MLVRLSKLNSLAHRSSVKKNIPFHLRFLLEGGYIKRIGQGNYIYDVLGTRVINNMKLLLRRIFSDISSNEVVFPFVQDRKLWEESGRLERYGNNIIFVNDRYLLSPSYEEVSDYLLGKVLSYKMFPQSYFAFSHCFRDELRPKNGLFRTNEFLLFNGYAYATDRIQYNFIYEQIKMAMEKFFVEISLLVEKAFFKSYDSEQFSEEFILKSLPFGENRLGICPSCKLKYRGSQFKYCDCGERLLLEKAVECADIIRNADYFSKKLERVYIDKENKQQNYYMVAFGLGLSKVLGILLESAGENFIWPLSLAPYKYVLIPSYRLKGVLPELLAGLETAFDLLIDDRDLSISHRVNDLTKLGFPYLVIMEKEGEFKLLDNLNDQEERMANSLHELFNF